MVRVTCLNLETLRRFVITGWGDTGPLVSTWMGTINRETLRFIAPAHPNRNVVVLDVKPS